MYLMFTLLLSVSSFHKLYKMHDGEDDICPCVCWYKIHEFSLWRL